MPTGAPSAPGMKVGLWPGWSVAMAMLFPPVTASSSITRMSPQASAVVARHGGRLVRRHEDAGAALLDEHEARTAHVGARTGGTGGVDRRRAIGGIRADAAVDGRHTDTVHVLGALSAVGRTIGLRRHGTAF